MIVKSLAKSRIVGGTPPSTTAPIEFEEICALCEKEIPNNKICLRHLESNNILCLICLSRIAEIGG